MAFVGLGFAGLELRLHQRDHTSAGRQQIYGCRQNLSKRNKGTIDHGQVERLERLREARRREVPRVRPLHHQHAPIVAQRPRELPLADVHRRHRGRASLQ